MLANCGGGGGGGSDSVAVAPPEPTEPAPEPVTLEVLDALPATTAVADPGNPRINFSHLAQSDLDTTITADCTPATSTTLRRNLFDLSSMEFDQILEHNIKCDLAASTQYTIEADGTRPNDATFRASHTIDTGTERTPGLTVQDIQAIPRDVVDDLFTGYVSGALLTDLDLPSGAQALLLAAILDLAEANWDNLVDPQARYDVISERVTYLSRDPAGEPNEMLTGLVVRPDTVTAERFIARNTALILTHATGSTPGDLNPADAWYILANQFAARGYLVIAPDNYGRGGTDSEPETYLLGSRTADNALDLIEQVFADPRYDSVYDGNDITIAGYSQGGHSAIGLWLALAAEGNSDLSVDRVYAGGAPLDLYETFRGVMQHLNGNCADTNYCRFVDEDTTVPFATDRILPGLLAYTNTNVSFDDIVTNDRINPDFINGFLNNDAAYDPIKIMLQLNGFTNIDYSAAPLANNETLIHLYHSDFDRLVPKQNTEDLVAAIGSNLTVDFHENRCNADGYELIFNLTDKVGVVHTLCGLAVLDDIMEDLR